jgi:ubiquinone/menaquinone biosynthesis C-methylase UbiE
MEWYEQWFGDEYLELYSHRNNIEAAEQIEFLCSVLPFESFESACDIACGGGRQAILLAKLIPRVVGLDLSPQLLKVAREKASQLEVKPEFLLGDMRELPFPDNSFDLITNFFTGFGYFDSDQEHSKLLKEWARVCKDGAFFVLDYLNRDYVIDNLVPRSESSRNNLHFVQERSVSADSKRVIKRITVTNKKIGDSRQFTESVRMYAPDKIEELLTGAGFEIKNLFGGFDGSAFTRESSRLLCISKINKGGAIDL